MGTCHKYPRCLKIFSHVGILDCGNLFLNNFFRGSVLFTALSARYGSREARARCSGWGRKSESATRHDTTRHPSLLIWNLTISDEIPYLKKSNFRRKIVKLGRTPYLKTDNFRRNFVKIGEIEAHSLFENWQVSTKISEHLWNWGALLIWKLASFDDNWWKTVKLRLAPFLKTGKFRRKLVKIGEIEAHSLFEN